jgi:dodecin
MGLSFCRPDQTIAQQRGDEPMSVAKVIELSATSTTSFEDAIQQGIGRATKTLKNVQGAWIKEQQVNIKDGKVASYRVNMMVTFILGDGVGE